MDGVEPTRRRWARTEPPNPPRQEWDAEARRRWWTREPSWWVKDVVVALLIGVVLVGGQWLLDNRRAAVDRQLEDQRNAAAERLENLRFIRDRSSSAAASRPFGSLDLRGLQLAQLHLVGATFTDADLTRAILSSTDLRRAEFQYARLGEANLQGTDLSHATLQSATMRRATLRGAILSDAYVGDADLRGADLTYTNLSGANLTRADLAGAKVDPVCYDADTTWPREFHPPPADRRLCERFKEVGDAPLDRTSQ
jgi:Pentapeptide repeats (8 copies)